MDAITPTARSFQASGKVDRSRLELPEIKSGTCFLAGTTLKTGVRCARVAEAGGRAIPHSWIVHDSDFL